MELLVQPVTSLPRDLEVLVTASLREDFGAVVKLRDAWKAGTNRFDRKGELLLAARQGDDLVGVCGLNVDLYCDAPRVGRVRHLYVHPDVRRHGVATDLLRTVVRHATGKFDVLGLRTHRDDAAAFYLARGFVEVEGDEACTHQLRLATSERFQTFEPDFAPPVLDRDQVTIREAGSQDIEGVAALAELAGDGDYEDLVGQIRAWWKQKNRHLVVAVSSDRVVGYGRASRFEPDHEAPEGTAPRGWYLVGLRVDPEWRGRGIGRELTRARLEWIGRHSTEAWYFANERNEVSRRLHSTMGFEEVTREFSFPGVSFEGGVGVLARAELQAG